MWKILEDYSPDYERGDMGYRGDMDGYEEGFEEGCEHGYRKAMKEMRHMGMRDNMPAGYGTDRMNRRYMPPYLPPYPSFRDEDDDYDYDEMDERRGRRRRDSRGRYM